MEPVMLGLGSCKPSFHTAIHAATRNFCILFSVGKKTLLMEKIKGERDRNQSETSEATGIQKAVHFVSEEKQCFFSLEFDIWVFETCNQVQASDCLSFYLVILPILHFYPPITKSYIKIS